MTTEQLKVMLSMHASTLNERERCLRAVDSDPDLPGEMPDEVWEAISSDRDIAVAALHIAVYQTKARIRERILAEQSTEQSAEQTRATK